MVSDAQIAELERRAEAASAGSPARLATVQRLIARFHKERIWPFSRDGHLRMLKIIAWPDRDAPRLLFPPPDKTSGEDQAVGAPDLRNQERTA